MIAESWYSHIDNLLCPKAHNITTLSSMCSKIAIKPHKQLSCKKNSILKVYHDIKASFRMHRFKCHDRVSPFFAHITWSIYNSKNQMIFLWNFLSYQLSLRSNLLLCFIMIVVWNMFSYCDLNCDFSRCLCNWCTYPWNFCTLHQIYHIKVSHKSKDIKITFKKFKYS